MPGLFVYGTLMCPDIFEKVTGVQLPARPAEVWGFRRFALKGEQYPALVKSRGGVVQGFVYSLPVQLWEKLDAFEGEQYKREPVMVWYEDGKSEPAMTYLFQPAFHHLLAGHDWDFESFLASGRESFMASYCLK